MASSQLLASLPALTLEAGCTVTFEAINPSTGAAVTGVTVTAAAIYATNVVDADVPRAEDETLALVELDGPSVGA